jgi:hypothetical protein
VIEPWGGGVLGRLVSVVAVLRRLVRRLDAGLLSPTDATRLVDVFASIERLAVAGKTLCAGRAAEAEPWLATGDRSGADWLAKRTGTTVSDARETLSTATHLAAAPATDAAFRSGELSVKQADAVASATAANPSAEARLLETASSGSLQQLRDEAARVRVAADPDPNARHDRIHRTRFWRRWTDAEGARCGSYRFTPEVGALFEAAAQPFIDAALDRARRTGEHEPSEAYAADGLAAMGHAASTNATAPQARGGRGRRRLGDRRELIGIVNLDALRRGTVEAGETCEIAGVGPVPVDVARGVFGDALLRIVIRDGVDIRTVVHTGRTANALQETAVLVRDNGRCVRPTCGLPAREIDHREPYSTSRTTTLDDLGSVCGHDHDLKTYAGHTYRRHDDGTVDWVHPDGTVERGRPPP